MSQKAEIRRYLEKGKTLTPMQALGLFGCFRLSARIKDLREDGHSVITRFVTTKSGKRIAEYRMPLFNLTCSVCGQEFRSDVAGIAPELCGKCFQS